MEPIRRRAAHCGRPDFARLGASAAASPALDPVARPFDRLLTALRWRVFGMRTRAASSPAVVVAIDEETFRTPPFEGTPSVDLDARDRPGADRHPRRRRQGRRLRHRVPDLDRAVRRSRSATKPWARGCAASTATILRALALGAPRRQGRARPGAASGRSGAALARPARRGRLRPQHPPAQRLQRSRRRRPPHAAHIRGRRRADPVDGGASLPRARPAAHADGGEARRRRRARCRTRSRSISPAAPTTSRPTRSPICAPASRRATRISSAASSAARSC